VSGVRTTLLSDGPSDRALLPILRWLLIECGVRKAIHPQWADLRQLRQPPRDMAERIHKTIELYPCELLFIHRDAERDPAAKRREEIQEAVERAFGEGAVNPPAICVIPVRMMEAWLLFDRACIRQAAGNRSERQTLELPPLSRLEALPDPKELLHQLLREASGLSGRRRRQFDTDRAVHRLADLIEDFSPLRALNAFRSLEEDVHSLTQLARWDIPDQ